MTDDEIITQYIEMGRDPYPAYLAIKLRPDGKLVMTVRSSGHAATSTMEMSPGALRRMATEILTRIPPHRAPIQGPVPDPVPDVGMVGGCDCGADVLHKPGQRPWCLRA